MSYVPNGSGASEQELRIRAAIRDARKRSFMTSALVVGSLIVLNLFLYASSHDAVWLLLDAVFAVTLSIRAWRAFGPDAGQEARIQQEVARLRHVAPPAAPGATPGSTPVPPPPPPAASDPNQSMWR
jgi:hypothetical protein